MLLFLFSCLSDQALVIEKEVPSEITAPEIFVTPNPINFNHLDALDEMTTSVYISNFGDQELDLSGIEFVGDLEFTLQDNETTTLQKGEQKEFSITFEPIAYDYYSGDIKISSNDFDEEIFYVPVLGHGDAPKIKVTPESYSFEDVAIPCFETKDIFIKNIGNKDLTIDNVSVASSIPQDFDTEYNWNLNGSYPWLLEPDEEIFISLEYNPKDLINDTSYIDITSNDPTNNIYTTSYNGNGSIERYMSEAFIVADTRVADLLFVIDNSGSMHPFQNALAGHFSDFLNIFLSLSVDFQIAVITTDDHNFVGNIIDSNTADPIADFIGILNTIYIYGSGNEKGLEQAYKATSIGQATASSGFIRSNAFLGVIFLSDERDHSYQNNAYYYNHFISLKSDPSKIKVHSIVGDYPNGCIYSGRNIEFGNGYYDLTNMTGGNFYSICAQDWGLQMQNLAFNSSGVSLFSLSEDPVVESIEVYVEGQLNEKWSYDEINNSILFDQGYIPDVNEEVRVDYGVLSSCQ